MEFASSVALSMLGGDDFTTIQEEIDILDASVVHKTGNLAESINGVKTFISDFVIDNVNTDIHSDTLLLRTGGDIKYQQDNTQTIIDNTDIVQLRLAGSSVLSATTGPRETTLTGDDDVYINCGGVTKIDIDTANTLSTNVFHVMNGTTNIALQVNGTDAIFLDANNTQLVGQNILVEGTSPIIGSLLTTPISFTTNAIEKLNIQTTSTTLDNTTTNIQSGGTNKITTNASTTTLNNTTTNIQSGGTNKITTNASTTTLNNTNIVNVATSAFVVQNTIGTDKVYVDSTFTEIENNDIVIAANTLDIALLTGPSGEVIVQNNTVEKLNIAAATTSISNTTINLRDVNNTTRFTQNNGTTTITNTNVNVAGILNVSTRLKLQNRPFQWEITGGGGNGTTVAGNVIGAVTNTGRYFSVISVLGGASSAAWSPTSGRFTAPTDGLYIIELNLFQNTTNIIGRTIILESAAIAGGFQYMVFNNQSTSGEAAFQCSQTLWLNSGQTFLFRNQTGANLVLYYDDSHTNINIIRIY